MCLSIADTTGGASGELVDEELADATLRPRYNDATATRMANRTRARQPQLEATDMCRFRCDARRGLGAEKPRKNTSRAPRAQPSSMIVYTFIFYPSRFENAAFQKTSNYSMHRTEVCVEECT